jgi:deoxyribonuclease V
MSEITNCLATVPEAQGPILAIDVQYVDGAGSTTGYASGVVFDTFASPSASAVYTVTCHNVAPYQPGSFFKRELPPIISVIEACPTPPKIVVIDGYVDLMPGKPGLGRHLFEHLAGTPVIGVAKNPFRDGRRDKDKEHAEGNGEPAADDSGSTADASTPASGEILRGSSARALYVTSAGIDQQVAEKLITSMHGMNRIPTVLKLVDSEARRAAKEGEGL